MRPTRPRNPNQASSARAFVCVRVWQAGSPRAPSFRPCRWDLLSLVPQQMDTTTRAASPRSLRARHSPRLARVTPAARLSYGACRTEATATGNLPLLVWLRSRGYHHP